MKRRAQVLIAGIGNVFLSDDGFGSAVATRLKTHALPPGVEVIDVGIRGMHLAYQLLDGYHTLVLIDTVQRGGPPGTLYLLEHDLNRPHQPQPQPDALNAHGMDPAAVLATLDELAAGNRLERRPIERALVLGCEPAALTEGLELSEPVTEAVDRAVTALIDLARDLIRSHLSDATSDEEGTADDPIAVRGATRRGGGADHQFAP